MSWSVTLAGETFTDANVAGTAYADEATGFPAILAAFAREAAFLQGLAATSATMLTPSVGPAVLTTHQDAATVGLSPGMLVRAVSAADPGRLIIATVIAFAGTSLTLDVIFAIGGAAADWLITRPTGGASLVLDPAPALAADLDAAGRSILGAASASLSGDLAVGGIASFAAAGQSRRTANESAGATATDLTVDGAQIRYLKLTADHTVNVFGPLGADYAANGYALEVENGGGFNLTLQKGSLLTNSNDLATNNIDTHWSRSNATPVQDVVSPTGDAWAIAATGAGVISHAVTARRTPNAVAPWDYVSVALLKAGTATKARLQVRTDTFGKGARIDIDLAAGTVAETAALGVGALLDYGIVDASDGWYLAWVAGDVGSDGGADLAVDLFIMSGAATLFEQAGETLLFGGASLYEGATFKGFQHVGASRALDLWETTSGTDPDFAAQAAGTKSTVTIEGPEIDGYLVAGFRERS